MAAQPMRVAVAIEAERGVLDAPEQSLGMHAPRVGLDHRAVTGPAGLCAQLGRGQDRVGSVTVLAGNLLSTAPGARVDAPEKYLRGLRVTPLAGDGSELLRMREFGDPGMAGRAIEAPMDRSFESRLVREKRDRLTRDFFLEVLVGMAAQTLLVAGLRRPCWCRVGCRRS